MFRLQDLVLYLILTEMDQEGLVFNIPHIYVEYISVTVNCFVFLSQHAYVNNLK